MYSIFLVSENCPKYWYQILFENKCFILSKTDRETYKQNNINANDKYFTLCEASEQNYLYKG